ncbi:MAG: MFS transporter, partial [Caulobacteraceae bacterium]
MKTDAPKVWAELLGPRNLPLFALLCLGVWLNAADTLVTATIMPSVAVEIGGYAYFAWAATGFMLGAIIAGASAGRMAERFGLRVALSLSAVVYMLGCIGSALAPDIGLFLAGRLLQGVGAGWIVGLCFVSIRLNFAEHLWAPIFASLSGVWGV